jgi:hypothetical protein
VGAVDPDANHETFRVLVLASVLLACRIGMKKKPSAPHERLAYIHLRISSLPLVGRTFKKEDNSRRAARKVKTTRSCAKKIVSVNAMEAGLQRPSARPNAK